jgi:hypothetical protein
VTTQEQNSPETSAGMTVSPESTRLPTPANPMNDAPRSTGYVVEWTVTASYTIWLDTNHDCQYVIEWRTDGSKHTDSLGDTAESLIIPEALADALNAVARYIQVAMENHELHEGQCHTSQPWIKAYVASRS